MRLPKALAPVGHLHWNTSPEEDPDIWPIDFAPGCDQRMLCLFIDWAIRLLMAANEKRNELLAGGRVS